MTVLGPNVVTLSDVKARLDPNGMLAKVVETLNLENGILDDIPWLEGNLPTGNQTTQRSSIPKINTRALNTGVATSKSTTRQVVDTCCLLEANSDIDREVLKFQNNPEGYRLSEDLAHAEGFRQTVASMLFYGDTNANAEQFNGLAVRYSTMTGAQKGNMAYQCIDAGGTGAVNTSAWLVKWHEESVCGIFPQNSTAGLDIEDMGLLRLYDQNNNPYWGYSTNMKWKPGLAVKNFRGVCRVANIDTVALQTFGQAADTSPALVRYMILAQNRIPKSIQGKFAWYVNELVYSYIQLMLTDKRNVYITRQELMDKPPQLFINGVPVQQADALLSTESRVV